MRVIKATIPMIESRVLIIGFVGENERTQVRIDCTAILTEYPHASPTLAIKPPVGAVYPVVVSREENDVVWNVSNADLQNEGDGELQLTFVLDGVVAKTVIGKLRISRSLLVTGEQPDVIQTWYDAATEKLAEVDAQIVELEGMVDTATDAATRAEQSEDNVTTAAANAATSAATATAKATEATTAATTATAKAAEAALSATQASNSAVSAADSESGATAKAAEAAQSAQTATAKAEQATEAAQTATEKAGDASASATAAHASEINAAESADDALAAQTAANAAKRAAETSATQAAISEQNAGTAAQTATQKAAEATQSATDAETFAGTATTNAEEAAASAQAASDAQAAVEEFAEQLADSLEQIDQNTQDIAELDERKANIDGYYQDMTVGDAEQLISSKYVENSEPYTFRTSGGSSDIGNREYLDAVVGGTVAWNQAVRDSASENSTDFAPIVTVTDAVEDAAGVKVKLEPVQDLHGYDHPWPAGGGKNLLDSQIETSGYIRGTDGAFVSGVDAWKCSTDYSPILPNTNYILYKYETATSSVAGYAIYDENKNYIDGNAYSSGATISITTPQNARYIRASWGRNASTPVALMLSTETDTSFSPYSNICPITGWDGVKVGWTGVNVWDEETELGQYNNLTGLPIYANDCIRTKNPISVKPNMTYYTTYGGGKMQAFFYKADETYIGQAWIGATNLITTPDGCALMRFRLASAYGTTYGNDISINFPSTDHDYHAYQGNTYSITLPTEAGTVYGGELTVNADGSGSLVVDRAKKILNGTEPYGTSSYESNENYAHILLANTNYSKQNQGAIMCDKLISNGAAPYFNNGVGVWQGGSSVWYICVKKEWLESDNSAGMMAWIANNNLTCVYKLATPQTYTLTASEIRTLLGENNIWADTGDIALTYTGTDEHLTLESGKKYLARLSGTDSMLLGSGQEITAAKGTDNVFDLTQMFGTAVADYVYGQGAGFFRRWFPNARYSYNAGELLSVEGLQSHDMVGFNAFDKSKAVTGQRFMPTGTGNVANTYTRSDYIRCVPGLVYYFKNVITTASSYSAVFWYDEQKNYISSNSIGDNTHTSGNLSATAPQNAYYMGINMLTAEVDVCCINLSHNASRNGEYEPYEKHSYPLDSTVILRGIPKVGANGVYWDGDRYLPDGTVERRYGVVDLGTLNYAINNHTTLGQYFYANVYSLNVKRAGDYISTAFPSVCSKYTVTKRSTTMFLDKTYCFDGDNLKVTQVQIKDSSYSDVATFKTAMSGVYLIYELDTPTTETAEPYHSTQWVNDWGTEEFVSTGLVPVGTETRYPANLRDKLQHLPDAASGNGSYLITQTDGQMVLTPFPAPPSTAGNYVLKATVVNGVATYTWEVAT